MAGRGLRQRGIRLSRSAGQAWACCGKTGGDAPSGKSPAKHGRVAVKQAETRRLASLHRHRLLENADGTEPQNVKKVEGVLRRAFGLQPASRPDSRAATVRAAQEEFLVLSGLSCPRMLGPPAISTPSSVAALSASGGDGRDSEDSASDSETEKGAAGPAVGNTTGVWTSRTCADAFEAYMASCPAEKNSMDEKTRARRRRKFARRFSTVARYLWLSAVDSILDDIEFIRPPDHEEHARKVFAVHVSEIRAGLQMLPEVRQAGNQRLRKLLCDVLQHSGVNVSPELLVALEALVLADRERKTKVSGSGTGSATVSAQKKLSKKQRQAQANSARADAKAKHQLPRILRPAYPFRWSYYRLWHEIAPAAVARADFLVTRAFLVDGLLGPLLQPPGPCRSGGGNSTVSFQSDADHQLLCAARRADGRLQIFVPSRKLFRSSSRAHYNEMRKGFQCEHLLIEGVEHDTTQLLTEVEFSPPGGEEVQRSPLRVLFAAAPDALRPEAEHLHQTARWEAEGEESVRRRASFTVQRPSDDTAEATRIVVHDRRQNAAALGGRASEERMDGRHFAELKKTRSLAFDGSDLYKRSKYWLQSFLAGIDMVACAYETSKGEAVSELRQFDVRTEELLDAASKKSLVRTLGAILRFLHDTVAADGGPSAGSASLWRLTLARDGFDDRMRATLVKDDDSAPAFFRDLLGGQ